MMAQFHLAASVLGVLEPLVLAHVTLSWLTETLNFNGGSILFISNTCTLLTMPSPNVCENLGKISIGHYNVIATFPID